MEQKTDKISAVYLADNIESKINAVQEAIRNFATASIIGSMDMLRANYRISQRRFEDLYCDVEKLRSYAISLENKLNIDNNKIIAE